VGNHERKKVHGYLRTNWRAQKKDDRKKRSIHVANTADGEDEGDRRQRSKQKNKMKEGTKGRGVEELLWKGG